MTRRSPYESEPDGAPSTGGAFLRDLALRGEPCLSLVISPRSRAARDHLSTAHGGTP
ncbi:MAG: hypothetical protein L0K84_00585 [Acidipropionibacterium jensenii]|nr:hypothetical protein [Acidipropionibacterium jensenii]